MSKNTTKSNNWEEVIHSDFWREVIERACVNQVLSIMMGEIEELKQKIGAAALGQPKGLHSGA